MKTYRVKRGFIAHQFDAPTYCIGIEMNALKTAGEYRCVIGVEAKEIEVSYDDALNLVSKYGESKIIRKIGGKNIFIIPVKDFELSDKT